MSTVTTRRRAVGASTLALLVGLTLWVAGVDSGRRPALAAPRLGQATGPSIPLRAIEIQLVVRRVAERLGGNGLAVCFVDRTGKLLALWHRPGATPATDELALSLARTGAFFGNDQAPLTSRTVRFISGVHFPPGVRNQPAGDLYGIENTNRVDRKVTFNPGKFFPPPLNVDGTGPSLGITTGKADLLDSIPYPDAVNPGGLPVFKNDADGVPRVVGGLGIAGNAGQFPGLSAEFAGVSAGGFRPGEILPGFGVQPENIPQPRAIFVGGIKLPTIVQRDPPPGHVFGPNSAQETGFYRVGPFDGDRDPEGWLVGPTGSAELSEAEVVRIVEQSVRVAERTRAAIRLPLGSRTRMVIGVSDLEGNILGAFRMPDSTVFSVDVAIAKARNVVYFSGPDRLPSELPGVPVGTAVTNRTIGFGAQPFFPSGINNSRRGPWFDLFVFDTMNPGTQGAQPDNGRQNGIVFFPGSSPLYKDGQLVGGMGVSGDGVDQDDVVTFHGSRGFRAPARIRADQIVLRRDDRGGAGVRLPFFKFVRNPFR